MAQSAFPAGAIGPPVLVNARSVRGGSTRRNFDWRCRHEGYRGRKGVPPTPAARESAAPLEAGLGSRPRLNITKCKIDKSSTITHHAPCPVEG